MSYSHRSRVENFGYTSSASANEFYISFKKQATSEQLQQLIEVRFSTKATSLVTDLFPEGKTEKSHEKAIYPIADGIKLQNTILVYCRFQ